MSTCQSTGTTGAPLSISQVPVLVDNGKCLLYRILVLCVLFLSASWPGCPLTPFIAKSSFPTTPVASPTRNGNALSSLQPRMHETIRYSA